MNISGDYSILCMIFTLPPPPLRINPRHAPAANLICIEFRKRYCMNIFVNSYTFLYKYMWIVHRKSQILSLQDLYITYKIKDF